MAERILQFVRESKNLLFLVALYCAALLIFAFVIVRVVDGLVPCPLCIIQRFFYAFVGLAAIAGHLRWWPRFTERVAVSFGSFLDDFIFALGGTGNCAIIDWSFIGLSIADWSLIAFTLLTAAGGWIYLKGKVVSSVEPSPL